MDSSVAAPRVAIAAGGAVTAFGLGLAGVEEAVRNNSSGLSDCPCLVGKGYQSTVCGCVPDEVWRLLREGDPAHGDAPAFLLASAALRESMLNRENPPQAARAGLANERTQRGERDTYDAIPASRRGLVLSTTKAEITALERTFHRQRCSAAAHRHLNPGRLAADLAAAHEIAGPVQCVSVACISGLLAIQQGVLLILEGKADLIFVVGVDLLSDFVLSGFSTLKSLDPGGCRPFDAARKGLSLGEAAGAVVLARREMLGGPALVVAGWGSSNDANHLTGPSRDGCGLALAMNRALRKAGVGSHLIDFVHAHGTGTLYNDAMEGMALRSVFGADIPPFCSSKGVFGHTLGAAGLVETLVCLVAAQYQLLPGTPGLQNPDPSIPDAVLQKPRTAGSLRRMIKVNAGFGGTNAALVMEWEAP
jgi:3-oxoacyl-[acyl-carrier-protein] synthase I